ncbi:YciI family protein [Kribbella sp. DT2]|uniref:YciI family protein n=1 Tax=Kribbella sp. DT2 TaxID=3393427 RepID=UPI003CF1F75D
MTAPDDRSGRMKYLVILHAVDQSRPPDHTAFRRTAQDAGELVDGHLLADPSLATVLGSPGAPIHACYLLDVDSAARAVELASLLPEATREGAGVDIRPVMFTAAGDY